MTDCCHNMDTSASIFYAAGLPAILSTGITICYFFLKLCSFAFHAISHQAKTRVAKDLTGGGKPEHGAVTQEESHPEVHEQISGSAAETRQYGQELERPERSVLLSGRGQDICLPSLRHDSGDRTESLICENAEVL